MGVDVQIASDAAGIPASKSIRDWVRKAINETDPGRDVDVSVRVVDEDEMRTLNRQYRDQNRSTNVPGNCKPLTRNCSPITTHLPMTFVHRYELL